MLHRVSQRLDLVTGLKVSRQEKFSLVEEPETTFEAEPYQVSVLFNLVLSFQMEEKQD